MGTHKNRITISHWARMPPLKLNRIRASHTGYQLATGQEGNGRKGPSQAGQKEASQGTWFSQWHVSQPATVKGRRNTEGVTITFHVPIALRANSRN